MKTFRLLIPVALFLIVILIPVGCGKTYYAKRLAEKQSDILEELQEHAAAFNRMIVWGDFDGASVAVVPEKRIEFLEIAQDVMARIRIENFSIPLCKVGIEPFSRDDKIPKADSIIPTPPPLTPPPDSSPREATPRSDVPEEKAKEVSPKERYKIPKVFYGLALVRYINMTVAPSVSVSTKLIKQHWVYVDGVWYCDADLSELLK